MVLVDDKALYERCKSLRNLCFSPDSDKRFIHEELGWNLRMTNLQAALGVAQLERIDQFIVKKRWIGEMYRELLSDIKAINLPVKQKEFAKNIYWVFAITLKDGYPKTAKEIMQELGARRVATRPFFYPIHAQPVFKKAGLFKNEEYPNATKLYERGFYIPSGMAITQEQIREVSKMMHEVLA
jgi:perosamine synthetase